MKRNLYIFFTIIYVILALASLSSCQADMASGEKKDYSLDHDIRIASWNVQTFFDSNNSGNEYDEFKKSKTWNQDAYCRRLEKLCSVIKALDAEVFVMQEIENEGVMYDISNFLAGEWNQQKIYFYACFAKDEGSAIGCGILSRYELSDMTVHSICSTKEGKRISPRMRPLIEVTVTKGGGKLKLFVNHWKSMSGGKEASELWRNKQEALLADRFALCKKEGLASIAMGDFNRDIESFCPGPVSDSVLLNGLEVQSPWFTSSNALLEPGSYYFNGQWSRIDNFFALEPAVIEDFAPQTNGPWCEEETFIPKKYKIWNESGYSDHLPIMCRVLF